MAYPKIRLRASVLAAAALLLGTLAGSVEAGRPAGAVRLGGLVELIVPAPPRDGIAPIELAEIRSSLAAYEKRARSAGKTAPLFQAETAPYRYPFFPQAGVFGRDLSLHNYTDQDPLPGLIRDFDCTGYTYDGHQGHDSLIRSFREQAVGVPVFAALPGVVVMTHDGEPDMNTVWSEENHANLVTIDHGGGYLGIYLHLRRGSVAVEPGQVVAAGTQLGLTGSSGFSNWPHLHFETWKDGHWVEPSAGPCRDGDSLWAAQAPIRRELSVAGFFMSPGGLTIPDREALLRDEAPRAATFVRGPQTVSEQLDLRNLPAGATYLLRVLDPRRKVAYETAGEFGNTQLLRAVASVFSFALDLSPTGTWRFQLDILSAEGSERAVDAPFLVVANARQVRNRRPAAVKVALDPARPVAGQVMTCAVKTAPLAADSDYDVVAYRYEWRVNGRLVRAVTSAAATDLLAADQARAGDRVSCRVVAGDGKSLGPAVQSIVRVEEP